MGRDLEREVAQDFGAEPIAQSDILELNHAVLRIARRGKIIPPCSDRASRFGHLVPLSVMRRIALADKTGRCRHRYLSTARESSPYRRGNGVWRYGQAAAISTRAAEAAGARRCDHNGPRPWFPDR